MKKLLLTTAVAFTLATSSFAGGGGDILRATVMVDNFENKMSTDERGMAWDSYAYVGYDVDKIYIYTEGERTSEEFGEDFELRGGYQNFSTESENQLVYSRAILPYWDIQAGIGFDTTPQSDKMWGVVAIQGLAPYFFETKTALLFDEDGGVGLRFDAEYEALITQKLILTPSISTSLYTQDNIEMGLGSGLSNITAGARLRYEFIREFAPYIGVEWSKNFGNTNDISTLNNTFATMGLRIWY